LASPFACLARVDRKLPPRPGQLAGRV